MVIKRFVVLIVVGVFVLGAVGVFAQEEGSDDPLQEIHDDTMTVVIDGHLHTTREILKIMDNSNLVYELGILPEDTVLGEEEPQRLRQPYECHMEGDEVVVGPAELSDTVMQLIKMGDSVFQAKDYKAALELYREALALDSGSSVVWTMVGDGFFFLEQYDSAETAFKKAIELNYIDYDAHWFLCDVYRKQGDDLRGLEELTIAHILNPNHETLKRTLVSRREAVGQPWRDWEFRPEYVLSSDAHRVSVRAKENWLGYAMAKAVWRYEPGYHQKMTGEELSTSSITLQEERECLAQLLLNPEPDQEVVEPLGDGYIDQFVFYEIWRKKYPLSLLKMPDIETKVGRIVEYINKYH